MLPLQILQIRWMRSSCPATPLFALDTNIPFFIQEKTSARMSSLGLDCTQAMKM